MYSLQRVTSLPENFGAFVDEITADMEVLYGPSAAQDYRARAARNIASALLLPEIYPFAVMEGGQALGLLVARLNDAAGEVAILHVLERHRERGIEQRLVDAAVNDLRAGGCDRVLCESVFFQSLAARDAFLSHGFQSVGRALMTLDAEPPTVAVDAPVSRALTEDDLPTAADVLTSAYRGHSDAELYDELRTPEAARAFMKRVAFGAYGRSETTFNRVICEDGRSVAIALAAEILQGVGFVLQLAVHPGWQGRGLGALLLQEQIAELKRAKLDRIGLGVTCDNPARRLYERVGFVEARRIQAYGWRRPGHEREML